MTQDVITPLLKLVADNYVFPEVGEQVIDVVRVAAAQGRYTGLGDEDLATAVTKDLQSINGDKHLRLKHHVDPLPELQEDSEVQTEYFRKWAESTSGGVARAERLAGNIGHLEIRPIIFPGSVAGEAISAAMTILSTTDALILDLRGCRGGEPSMTAFLCSYFFGDEQVELSGMYFRQTDRVQQMWTSTYVPGRKFGLGKPVYVLTSGATFSGGEAVAYDLKHSGRATVIGETTLGGAHPRKGYRLTAYLEATIPTGRSVHPVTGSNWEGTGVTPDIEVPAADALQTAHRLALEHVVGTSDSRMIKEEAQEALR